MRRHAPEVWAEARRMVVQDGVSYAEAARATGIAASTIQKRAAREEWQSQRASTLSYGAQIRAMKARLLEKAMETLDPQLIYAWKQAEAAYPEHRYQAGGGVSPDKLREVGLRFLELLVSYLEKHDRNLLAAFEGHLGPFGELMLEDVARGA